MKKFFKIGCLGFIGLFVLLMVIGLIFGEDSPEESKPKDVKTDTEEPVKGDSDKEETTSSEVEKASVGTALKVGDVEFTVNEVSTTNEIKDSGGYISYEPDSEGAVFLVVNVTVKNNGKEAITTDSSFFKLIDGDIEYSPSTIITTDSSFFLYDGINPGLSKQGNVLFEIPEGKQDLLLNVQTGFWGTEQGQIKLN